MKKVKKVLALTACAAMLVTASVMGTIAYLTSQDAVTNTFTVGNVNIVLDEAKVKTDGTYFEDHDVRVKANEYHLLPGRTYYKDPTVTVKKGSESSYIRMIVKVDNIDNLKQLFTDEKYYGVDGVFLLQNLIDGWNEEREYWKFDNYKQVDAVGVYEFRYYETVAAPDGDVVLDDLFETITIPGEDVTSDNIHLLDNVQIDVVAQAIQSVGFDGAGEKSAEDVAWEAFDKQQTN